MLKRWCAVPLLGKHAEAVRWLLLETCCMEGQLLLCGQELRLVVVIILYIWTLKAELLNVLTLNLSDIKRYIVVVNE